MRALLIAALLAGAPVQAQDDTLLGLGLDPVAREVFHRAVAHERRGDWGRAASAYRLVLEAEPDYTPATVALGRSLERLGRVEEAREVFERLPMEADAVEGLAGLLVESSPEQAAELYVRLQTLRLGDPGPHRLECHARTRAGQLDLADEACAGWLSLLDAVGGTVAPDQGSTLLDLAVARRDFGDRAGAEGWLQTVVARVQGGPLAEEAKARLERLAVEAQAEALGAALAQPLPAEAQRRLEEARLGLARGELAGARLTLEGLVDAWPRSPEVWASWGDLALAEARLDVAEQAFVTAVALDPAPEWRLRLGRLLADAYGGRRHREAVEELRAVIAARPGWTEVQHELGVLHQELGAWSAAEQALQRYVDLAPDGPLAADAGARLADLARERPAAPDFDRVRLERPLEVPDEAFSRWRIARVYQARDELGAAAEEAQAAWAAAPDWVEAANLVAALASAAGQGAAAEAAWRASLELDPSQGSVYLALGELLLAEGRADEAHEVLEQAASRGVPEASCLLAEAAARGGQWGAARRRLQVCLAGATGGPVQARARTLQDELDRRRGRWVGLGLAAGLALSLVPVGLVVRGRGRIGIEGLLDRHPEAYPEAAPVLSAMRHEVLKHNTTVLGALADALERGDPAPAREVALTLLGEPGRPGVVDRWDQYVAVLERLARRFGRRLHPDADPLLGPMSRAFQGLRRLGPRLARGRLGPRDLLRLRELDTALNDVGYRALGDLVRTRGVVQVDASLVRACWERVATEPAFDGHAVPPLEVLLPADALPVRVPRSHLEDVLVNVLRNNLKVVLQDHPTGASTRPRLGLRGVEELDAVTGLETVALRFQDNAVRELTDAMIRGRTVARGLGLVVELLAPVGGSVGVEPEPGWSKAVVVRLPRADVEVDGA